jgi:hypothetical protein
MNKSDEPFAPALLSTKVFLSFTEVGNNIAENLKKKIEHKVEGKCIPEGYIMPNSIRIESFSNGKIVEENVEFEVFYHCNICLPVEGMEIECITKFITKAGVHAEYIVDNKPIITFFITRDDNYDNPEFVKIKGPHVKILAKVTGVTYELNDPTICVIADLVKII